MVLAVLLVLFQSCSSFPKPSEEKNSLLIIMAERGDEKAEIDAEELMMKFYGDEEFTVDMSPFFKNLLGGKRQLYFVRVAPGEYRYVLSNLGLRSLEIRNNSVTLLSSVLTTSEFQQWKLRPRPIAPEEQRWVSEEVRNYINFYDWYGKKFVGFGPFIPRFTIDETVYDLNITTTPAEAEITIDEQAWGKSPLTAKLEPGKHLLRVEKEGYKPIQTYVTVEGDGEFSLEMEQIEVEEAKAEKALEAKSTYALTIFPFQNLGSEDMDNLSTVFSDGIVSGLFDRQNIRLIEEDSGLGAEKRDVEEEFSRAEAMGAELLITGLYSEKEGNLIVSAALYDVRTERVKTNMVYTGESGLAMFDSIDEMTGDFLANVDKVLPAEGKEVIEKEQVVTQEMVAFQRRASGKQIADRRHSRIHSLSVLAGFGATVDAMDAPWEMMGGPVLTMAAQYELDIIRPLGLLTRVGVPVTGMGDGNGIPIQVGPTMIFSGRGNDITLGVLGFTTFYPPFEYYDENFMMYVNWGPFLSFGAALDANLKIYHSPRLDGLQGFILIGMWIELVQMKMELPTSLKSMPPFGGCLYAGYGLRL